MALFSWQKKQKEDGTEELQLSKEAQEQMDKTSAAVAELPEIKTKLSKLDAIDEFITTFKKKEADKEAAAARKTQQEQQQQSDEDLDTLFLTDPKAATAKAMQPTQQALLQLRADNIRRETFEDTKKFKFYHGDIKSEVDNLIAGQTLAARNDPSVIENAYLTVVGKHHDEIMEGKIKDRFAGSDGGSRGTSSGSAGDTGSRDTKAVTITDDIRKLAKSFGVKPEEYAKMLDDEGIGYA